MLSVGASDSRRPFAELWMAQPARSDVKFNELYNTDQNHVGEGFRCAGVRHSDSSMPWLLSNFTNRSEDEPNRPPNPISARRQLGSCKPVMLGRNLEAPLQARLHRLHDRLLNHLIGKDDKTGRHRDAERLGRLEIDHEVAAATSAAC